MDYVVVQSRYIEGLRSQVNAYLKQGYMPISGIAISKTINENILYLQSVYKA